MIVEDLTLSASFQSFAHMTMVKISCQAMKAWQAWSIAVIFSTSANKSKT